MTRTTIPSGKAERTSLLDDFRAYGSGDFFSAIIATWCAKNLLKSPGTLGPSNIEYLCIAASTARLFDLGLIGVFIASLKAGCPPPVSGQDGLDTIRILEAIASSLEKGDPSLV